MAEKQPNLEYYDPKLIEQAAGDQALLDRLVGLQRAEYMLEKDPDNESYQRLAETMRQVIDERMQSKDKP